MMNKLLRLQIASISIFFISAGQAKGVSTFKVLPSTQQEKGGMLLEECTC
jgi:hypothetical protein